MSERRVAEVVRQRERLGQVLIETERAGERAGDLGDFQRVRQASAVVVALMEHEYLRFMLEAAERGRMDDPVSVASECTPAGAGPLRKQPSVALAGVLRVRRARVH